MTPTAHSGASADMECGWDSSNKGPNKGKACRRNRYNTWSMANNQNMAGSITRLAAPLYALPHIGVQGGNAAAGADEDEV